MSSVLKSEKHGQAAGECDINNSPVVGAGSSGHKASFRSTKLARRARSFKEDILEKFSQMRSPGGTATFRSHSPKSRHSAPANQKHDEDRNADKNPSRELDVQVRQVQVALKHFRDVVSKKKLEMLPGNGTIVLETVTVIHTALKHCLLDAGAGNHSTALGSATHQVYQSLARLIKLCDDVLLHGDQSAALGKENVGEVVTLVEEAVQNLVKLAQDKLANRESHLKSISMAQRKYGATQNPLEVPGQRNSLPDIPLTPRERQILEQTCVPANLVRNSHSSESILRDTSPPPKPPLPDNICLSEPDSNSGTPPPIPPKKRGLRAPHLLDDCGSSDNSLLGCSIDRVSLRSRSPEDSSSLLSASAGSLDSVLNQSRDEEEIRALMDPIIDDCNLSNNISDIVMQANGTCLCSWDDSSSNSNASLSILAQPTDIPSFGMDCIPNTESGFGSVRSSLQSFTTSSTSKRSSQQSSTSQWKQTPTSIVISQQNSLVKSESVIQNLTKMQKSESIVQNLNMKSEISQQKNLEESSAVHILRAESSIQSFSKKISSNTALLNEISNFTSLGKTSVNSFDGVDCGILNHLDENGMIPPLLPEKTKLKKNERERRPSQYDNVPPETVGEHVVTCAMHQSQGVIVATNVAEQSEIRPPPLPPKKKHIMAYMEMFGNCSHSAGNADFLRHSVHTYNMMKSEWHAEPETTTDADETTVSSLSTTQSCSFSTSHSSSHAIHAATLTLPLTDNSCRGPLTPSPTKSLDASAVTPPALPPKKSRVSTKSLSPSNSPTSQTAIASPRSSYSLPVQDTVNINSDANKESSDTSIETITHRYCGKNGMNNDEGADQQQPLDSESVDLLEKIDVSEYLALKKPDEDGPDIRGGHPDALIIHATKGNKHAADDKDNDFKYQEAFLTTYRTFLQPLELVQKLQMRHQRFSCHSDSGKQRAAKESFSLLASVVNGLTALDLDEELLQTLMEFVYQLVCRGDLAMAKALRVIILEKHAVKQHQIVQQPFLPSLNIYTRSSTLLDFKSEQIAEQMTLLDAELFMRIEIPEVLIWAQEQNEERSPNLTCFTEHFNKMSYWARSRILEQNEAKDRERYVVKFIKIMKHLRKINNFNSYLALLSALDSAPIRRLEWQKQITEGLKEYCALIDSSSSFRAYRQALSETQPPCIPYIGLILQDLTFVHIGNNDALPDGSINFSKRWQQFNIVDNMKRFKKGTYQFKKHDRIIAFFNNFDDFICEEAMWQISESIKPRGGKKPLT